MNDLIGSRLGNHDGSRHATERSLAGRNASAGEQRAIKLAGALRSVRK